MFDLQDFKQRDIFPGLDDDTYRAVLGCFEPDSFEKVVENGEVIAVPDTPVTHLLIIMEGSVKCTWFSPLGEELIADIFGSMQTRVAMCARCVTGGLINSYYVATSSARILYIPRENFLKALSLYPAFKDYILISVCSTAELRLMHHFVTLYKKAKHRLCRHLLNMHYKHGETFILEYSLSSMAQYLNLARPTLSKELHNLQNMGAIALGKNKITILKPEILSGIMLEP